VLALNRLAATRIVAAPAALDTVAWPPGLIVLRLAADEVLLLPSGGGRLRDAADVRAWAPALPPKLSDAYAIVVPEGGFSGQWIPAPEALALLARHCEWELPRARPAFAQGAVAGIPAKLWLEPDRVLFVVPAPFAADFQERII